MKRIIIITSLALLSGSFASAGAPKYGPGWGSHGDLVGGMTRVRTTSIPAGQLKVANASPQTIVPAPGAGYGLVFEGAVVWYDYNTTAYESIASGDDLAISYTDANGTQLAEIEATGFLDQASDRTVFALPHAAASGSSTLLGGPDNAPIVAHMLNGEITIGDSPLKMKIYYRVIPTSW